MWYILSAILAICAFILIIFFFITLGCPFELIKCYITRNDHKDVENSLAEENSHRYTHNQDKNNNNDDENIMPFQHLEVLERPMTNCDYLMCLIVGVIGLFLQPLYLIFYILYAMMECYRRMSCWMYYYSF